MKNTGVKKKVTLTKYHYPDETIDVIFINILLYLCSDYRIMKVPGFILHRYDSVIYIYIYIQYFMICLSPLKIGDKHHPVIVFWPPFPVLGLAVVLGKVGWAPSLPLPSGTCEAHAIGQGWEKLSVGVWAGRGLRMNPWIPSRLRLRRSMWFPRPRGLPGLSATAAPPRTALRRVSAQATLVIQSWAGPRLRTRWMLFHRWLSDSPRNVISPTVRMY